MTKEKEKVKKPVKPKEEPVPSTQNDDTKPPPKFP
jgi:hypothetical protein